MITLLSFPRKRSNFQQTSTAFEEDLRSLMIPKELSAIRWSPVCCMWISTHFPHAGRAHGNGMKYLGISQHCACLTSS